MIRDHSRNDNQTRMIAVYLRVDASRKGYQQEQSIETTHEININQQWSRDDESCFVRVKTVNALANHA